ncbi:MAG: hypothetical protein WD847_14565 [Pirellulales bacterium]
MPAATGEVLIWSGEESPAPLSRTLVWTGQGSVLPLRVPLALWRLSDGRMQAASEESFQVEGLVRTVSVVPVRHGRARRLPGSCGGRCPLRSTQPPGIGDESLNLPRLKPSVPSVPI